MTSLWVSSKTLLILTLTFVTVLPWNRAYEIHKMGKRQIGVLARTGALPQGKRSVEVLARNGELPHQTSNKKEPDNDLALDLLIQELESAESLSKLRVQALTEKMLEQRREEERWGTQKRSVAALARNGELPQKRLSEVVSRSGYLVRPPQETVQPPPDLLNPDDFLADGQSSMIPVYLDERAAKVFFLRPDKRTVGSARNFLFSAENLESGINLYNKKKLGSLTRDDGLSALRNHLIKEMRVDGPDDLQEGNTKNTDPSRNFVKRENQGMCWSKSQKYKNRNMELEVPNKGNSKRIGRERVQEGNPDYEDSSAQFYSEGIPVEKRFLGRIPQLGRIHQKVQSPSSRRRPHLRPNWL